MSSATQGDGIFFLTNGDSINPVAESVVQASTIQNAFNERELYSHRWTDASARTAETGMKPGDLGMQADTTTLYLYTGAKYSWQPITFGSSRTISGSALVTPTGDAAPFGATAAVTFPTGFFSQTPFVQTSAYTSRPDAAFCSPQAPTTAGFNIILKRNDSATATTIYWTAVQN